MPDLVQSLAAVGAAFALNAARRAAGTIVGLLSVFGLGATSALFFTIAGYRALEQAIGGIYAPVVVGALYLVAALIALLVVQARKS
jgi:hypothetical protein